MTTLNHGGGGHGGHGGGGGGHFGGHWGGGRGRRGGYPYPIYGGGGGWGWNYPWPYPQPTVQPCASWGNPAPLDPDLVRYGMQLLAPNGGTQPVSGYYNGVLYRFSFENGVVLARPCASAGALGITPRPTGQEIKSVENPYLAAPPPVATSRVIEEHPAVAAAQTAAVASGADTSHPAVQAAVDAAAHGAIQATAALPPNTPAPVVQQHAIVGAQTAVATSPVAAPVANHPAVQAALQAAIPAAVATVVAAHPAVVTHPVIPATAPVPAQPIAIMAPSPIKAPSAAPPPVVTHPAIPATAPVPHPAIMAPTVQVPRPAPPTTFRPTPPAGVVDYERWRREQWRARLAQPAPPTEFQPQPPPGIVDYERWRHDQWMAAQQAEQQWTQYQPPVTNTYYLYRLDPVTGWAPVSFTWLSYADVQKWIAGIDPNATYGAYDQNMQWTPMATT